tara:strand:+ start:698 stop:1483 length:786 start_codon:yes stop_codon:yes gene_type:complete
MKRIGLVFLTLLFIVWISGCVQQPTRIPLTPEEIADRAQQSAKTHTELAAAYYNRKQFRVAIAEVDEALQANPNYAPAYNMMGLINMTLKEDRLAQENFERALSLSPKNSEAHNNYGWFLCQRVPEKMEEAIKHFMMALRDPLYATPERAYTNAGLCELTRGRYKDAADFLHNALTFRPTFSPALVGLIEIDFRSGDLRTAKSKLSRHLQHASPTSEALWLAIQIERKTGDRYAEESYTYQLQKHFPDSKEAATLRQGRLR